MFTDWMTKSFGGNTVQNYGLALGFLVAGLTLSWVFNRFVLSRLRYWALNTKTQFDDFLVATLGKTLLPLLYFGAIIFAFHFLNVPPALRKTLVIAATAFAVFLGVRLVNQVLRLVIVGFWVKNHKNEAFERQVRSLMPILSALVWVGGFLLMMDNMGFKISTVLAGLGIGGIAVALASQAVLGDLFAYFSITFDRPFELGDFIIVGDSQGSVEYIGIKTTRLRSLGGEQLIFANTDLTGSRVRNFKSMEIRRIVFNLGVTYDTPSEKLKEIPQLLRDIMTAVPNTRVDRVHFATYGNFSLNFECVYFVLSDDYMIYMDAQEKINFAIKDAFEKRGINFAFPTQTIHMAPSVSPLTGGG